MKSKQAAIENLKLFFSKTIEDSVSLEEIYKVWGRDLSKEEINRSWFSNMFTPLKYYNLLKPVYGLRNSKRVLKKVQLTMEGKRALGRIESSDTEPRDVRSSDVDFKNVMKMVAKLKEEYPEFEISFDVRLKNS